MSEKRYNVWDIDGTIFLEDHKEGSYHIGQVENVDINCLNDIANRLNNLSEENEQLQKKNDNLVHMIARVQYRADTIKDENEQLKADKQSLIDFIKKEFPKSHKHILEGFE